MNKRKPKPADTLLASAARTVGTVAGKIAAGLGIAEPKSSSRDGRRKPLPTKSAPKKAVPKLKAVKKAARKRAKGE